ncbi:MAG: oligoribonuclease, partial [Oleispira sp.]
MIKSGEKMSRTDTLVWMDLEMTGLDPEDNVIIEIATIITDDELNIVAEGPVIAVHQPDFELAKMDDWNVKTHNGSGLVERIKASTVSMGEAEKQTIEFIALH